MSTLSGPGSERGFTLAGAGALAALVLAAVGCAQGIQAKPVEEAPLPPESAMEVLKRVIDVYHEADSYEDHGRLVVQYTFDGKTYLQTSEFSLSLDGPNRLRLHAYDALAVCDGQTFRATIEEAPGEVLSYPAPEELSPAMVYRDPVLGKALNEIVGAVPLSLFHDPEPLPGFQFNARAPQLDTPEKIGDDLCYRVRIERREGALVLWIDQQTFVVRRVEYPADGYRQLVEAYPGAITGMTITAELDGARLNPAIDDAKFRLELPPGAELVKHFDAVLVGARIPKFKMRTLDGEVLTRESLADKIVVIKFWMKDYVDRYLDDLKSFEQVWRRYQDQNQDSVVFLAANVDDDDVSDEELKTAWTDAGLTLPIVRIDMKVAFRSFGFGGVPTTVILGRDGSLQEHQTGSYPDQAVLMPRQIDTLLTGGELVWEAPQQPPQYQYYSVFAWQNPQTPEDEQEPGTRAEFANAEIAPASEPELLRPTRLWGCTEVTLPGNLIAITDSAGRDHVLVLDDSSNVIEIGADGKVFKTHHLPLPEGDEAKLTLLRTAVDGAGNRSFLAFKTGGKLLYVFDANWKKVLVFPEQDENTAIADARLADLDGDGQLEMLVGYQGLVGVHCVGLDGQRLWRNRAAEYVFGLGVSGADTRGRRMVLAAQGMLLPIDADGNDQSPIFLNDAFVRLISTADVSVARSPWCAIGTKTVVPGKPMRDVALGLSASGQVKWRYPLPAGKQHHAAFEMVATGDLLGRGIGEWVVAGPDGSIHILSLDGDVIDQFNYGASLSGMTIARLDGQPALIIASEASVEAWKFEMPAQTTEAEAQDEARE